MENITVDIGIEIKPENFKTQHDLSAYIFGAEPYISDLALHFRGHDIKVHLHGTKDIGQDLLITQILSGHPLLKDVVIHPSRETFLQNNILNLSDMLEKGLIAEPSRTTPTLGNLPKDLTNLLHPPRLGIVVEDDKLPTPGVYAGDVKILTPAQLQFDDYKNLDIIATDSPNVAMTAFALGIRDILLLCRDCEADELPKGHDIRTFRYRSGEDMYPEFFDFLKRYWPTYKKYPAYLNVGNAQSFIQARALDFCKGYGLDVGSNHWPFYGALPSDVNSRKFERGPFDFIFSSHCLEHIGDWDAELRLWHSSLKRDGVMFMYLPHPLMEPWRPEGDWCRGGWHLWSPEPLGLVKFLSKELDMEILEYTTRPDAYWSFHIAARKK